MRGIHAVLSCSWSSKSRKRRGFETRWRGTGVPTMPSAGLSHFWRGRIQRNDHLVYFLSDFGCNDYCQIRLTKFCSPGKPVISKPLSRSESNLRSLMNQSCVLLRGLQRLYGSLWKGQVPNLAGQVVTHMDSHAAKRGCERKPIMKAVKAMI